MGVNLMSTRDVSRIFRGRIFYGSINDCYTYFPKLVQVIHQNNQFIFLRSDIYFKRH